MERWTQSGDLRNEVCLSKADSNKVSEELLQDKRHVTKTSYSKSISRELGQWVATWYTKGVWGNKTFKYWRESHIEIKQYYRIGVVTIL